MTAPRPLPPGLLATYVQQTEQERLERRAAFHRVARSWSRLENIDCARADVASRWEIDFDPRVARFLSIPTFATSSDRPKLEGDVWCSHGPPTAQATHNFVRYAAYVSPMYAVLQIYPLAIGSLGTSSVFFLGGRVNVQSSAQYHETVYDINMTAVSGCYVSFCCSRRRDRVGSTRGLFSAIGAFAVGRGSWTPTCCPSWRGAVAFPGAATPSSSTCPVSPSGRRCPKPSSRRPSPRRGEQSKQLWHTSFGRWGPWAHHRH